MTISNRNTFKSVAFKSFLGATVGVGTTAVFVYAISHAVGFANDLNTKPTSPQLSPGTLAPNTFVPSTLASITSVAEFTEFANPTDLSGRVPARATIDILPGSLVTMTGANLREADSLRLGILPSSRANDPAILGVVVPESLPAFDRAADPQSTRGTAARIPSPDNQPANPNDADRAWGWDGPGLSHDVAISGVARLWIVEDKERPNRDLAPGDLLISADADGCAMLDDIARFEVGYIVARVAERVRWDDPNRAKNGTLEVGRDGRRRTLVAVLVERAIRPPLLSLSRQGSTTTANSLTGITRDEAIRLQRDEQERWQRQWEADAQRRWKWDDMNRTWDELDRWKRDMGDAQGIRESSRKVREHQQEIDRLRDTVRDLDRKLDDVKRESDRRESERRNNPGQNNPNPGGRDTTTRGTSGGIKPS